MNVVTFQLRDRGFESSQIGGNSPTWQPLDCATPFLKMEVKVPGTGFGKIKNQTIWKFDPTWLKTMAYGNVSESSVGD